MSKRTLKRRAERERIQEEEDDLLKTDKERELIQIQQKQNLGGGNNQRRQYRDNNQDDGDDDESIDNEGEQQKDEQFDKLQNIHKLFLKKKITKQNAFDVEIGKVDLAKYNWVNSSNFLKNLSEIHGLRVENIHQESYKLLGLINRTEDGIQNENNEDGQNEQKQTRKQQIEVSVGDLLSKLNKYKSFIDIGEKTLEQKMENLDVTKYDIEFDLDPLLKQTLSKFDDSSNRGLFLTNTHLDKKIILQLEQQQQEKPNEEKIDSQGMKVEDANKVDENEDIEKSYYQKFLMTEKQKPKFDNPQLCPKLMEFKITVESDAKLLKLPYNLTDSDYVKGSDPKNLHQSTVAEMLKQNEQQQNQIDETNCYGDMMDQLDVLMEEKQESEQQEEDEEINQQEEDQDKPSEDQDKSQNEENDNIEQEEENDEDSNQLKDKQLSQNGENQEETIQSSKIKNTADIDEDENSNENQEFDLEEAQNRLKDIGKGKMDKELQLKLKVDDEENKEKKGRRKRNELQKLEDQSNLLANKKNKEFQIVFDHFDQEEDKEICFGLQSNRKQVKVDFRLASIKQKIDHSGLEEFQYGIQDSIWNKFYLVDRTLEQQQHQNLQQPIIQGDNEEFQNYEEYEMDENIKDNQEEDEQKSQQSDHQENSDMDEEFFAQANQSNEKSLVKIKDLKLKLWKDIQDRFKYIEKKQLKKQKKSKKIQQEDEEQQQQELQTVQFTEILSDIPDIMGQISKKISLQSSFITILHLCNENILKLEDESQLGHDFKIIGKEYAEKEHLEQQEILRKQEEEKQARADKRKKRQSNKADKKKQQLGESDNDDDEQDGDSIEEELFD